MRNASHLLGSDAHPSITMNYLEHIENCKNSRVTRQTFPEKGEVLTFKKVESLHHHPMLIYLDFETANQSLSEVREGVKKKTGKKQSGRALLFAAIVTHLSGQPDHFFPSFFLTSSLKQYS